MKQLRKSVFETNSSSSHSISIDSTGAIDTSLIPDDNGVLILGYGCNVEFGWEQEEYNDAETKAVYSYLQAAASDNEKYTTMLYDVIMKQTAAKEVIFAVGTQYGDDNYGYIDHQSAIYEAGYEPFDSEAKLRDFIFKRGSYIETDNDNH